MFGLCVISEGKPHQSIEFYFWELKKIYSDKNNNFVCEIRDY